MQLIVDRILGNCKPNDPQEIERRLQAQRAYESNKSQEWEQLINQRGARYHDCSLENFMIPDDYSNEAKQAMQLAIEQLTVFAEQIVDEFYRGTSVVLFGPKGTGKDHLMMSLARCAIRSVTFPDEQFGERTQRPPHVVWTNGADLFGSMRDSIGDGGEAELITRFSRKAELLLLSDPVPPSGKLTEFQMDTLYRIVDDRYNCRRPIWLTINVASGRELNERVGAVVADRLIDDALGVFCNWPSYRRLRS